MNAAVKSAALAVAFTAGIICPAASEPSEGPLPQLGQFVIKGLDVRQNKIDELISRFGFICLKISEKMQRPCIIEGKLISYLKTLPPNQVDIERELSMLGAVCETKEARLDCVYLRQVEKSIGFAGSPEPEAVVDEFFRIEFGIVQSGDGLDYQAKFDRKQTVKWRRGMPKGT
jgi:hypothetical protein